MASMWSRPVLTTPLNKVEVRQSWDKPWCSNTHGERPQFSLGITLHAISCRAQSLPTCTLPRVRVSRQAPAPGQLLPAEPWGLSHPSCPRHQGTKRPQRGRGRALRKRKRSEYVSSFQRAFLKEQRCRVHRRHFTPLSKALIWERPADRRHCMYCTGPHSRKQGKRSKPPLQSQQSRLFIPLFVCSFRLKRLSRFTQVSALKKWANWIWTLGQLAAVSKEQKAVLILWIGYQSTACAPRSFPVGSPHRCPAEPRGGEAAGHSGWAGGLAAIPTRSVPCPAPRPQLPFHMQGMGSC